MADIPLQLLQQITAPFALTAQHVQGPGGNTSVKQSSGILIKASGFTFNDVASNTGVVLLNNQEIVDNLSTKLLHADSILENAPPQVVSSFPEGLKPSMEFEFHSILKKYVLHTHSVYANVITCAAECENILKAIFKPDEYLLVPYVTPGFPIAAWLLKNMPAYGYPAVIFLKNHGIIVHGDNAETVIATYNRVQHHVMEYLHLAKMNELRTDTSGDIVIVNADEVSRMGMIPETAEEFLVNQVLIPDQSIFFRNKVSSTDEGKEIYIDVANKQIKISGTQKFTLAATEMLSAVYYIANSINTRGMQPDYISEWKIQEMHGLSAEKHRSQLLKNKE